MNSQDDARATIIKTQVNATLAGHDIGEFKPAGAVAGGCQARCRRCGQTEWIGDQGLWSKL